MLTCKYCRYCRSRLEGDNTTIYCSIGSATSDEACSKFEKATYFYCRRNDQRLSSGACINRYRLAYSKEKLSSSYGNCENCSQYYTVLELHNYAEMLRLPIPKRLASDTINLPAPKRLAKTNTSEDVFKLPIPKRLAKTNTSEVFKLQIPKRFIK